MCRSDQTKCSRNCVSVGSGMGAKNRPIITPTGRTLRCGVHCLEMRGMYTDCHGPPMQRGGTWKHMRCLQEAYAACGWEAEGDPVGVTKHIDLEHSRAKVRIIQKPTGEKSTSSHSQLPRFQRKMWKTQSGHGRSSNKREYIRMRVKR